ncbi:MAG: beta-aspartyl-peptidase [Planctomycetes bacterium]|nr:beta-aspartyl-peptidase [Planctomycetota bacterium]MCB9903020.1 beta-aspartyl-peptidase [Planctomycetota bacterium]
MITILRNVDLFAPEALGRTSLVIAGGKLIAYGDDVPSWSRSGAVEEVDLRGARVIPGLVDGHAHTTGGGGEAGPETRVPAPCLSGFTRAGVTTVVGLLGTDAETRSMEALLATTRALRAEGLGAWCYTGGYHLPPRTLTGSLRGDIVHLDAVIGVGELALSDFRSSQPTLDELLRVASEAQVGGMLAGKAGVVHLHLGDGPRGLDLVRRALDQSELPARVFNPTHVNRQPALFEESLELARRGCTIDVTCFPVEEGDPALSAEGALGAYFDADLPRDRITASSDSGGCLPTFDAQGEMTHMDVGRADTLANTLAALLREGRALETVLPAFTSNPARHLKLAGKGTLAAGCDADLVVLGHDDLPRSVMVGGDWHVHDGEVLRRGTFETNTH